jgi:hypothetical protein
MTLQRAPFLLANSLCLVNPISVRRFESIHNCQTLTLAEFGATGRLTCCCPLRELG